MWFDVVFGVDIIVGFLIEMEEMFQNLLKIVDDCGLMYFYVFLFLLWLGILVVCMLQLLCIIVKECGVCFWEKGVQVFLQYLVDEVGKICFVLIEKEGFGWIEQFMQVELVGGYLGEIVDVCMIGYIGCYFLGEVFFKVV